MRYKEKWNPILLLFCVLLCLGSSSCIYSVHKTVQPALSDPDMEILMNKAREDALRRCSGYLNENDLALIQKADPSFIYGKASFNLMPMKFKFSWCLSEMKTLDAAYATRKGDYPCHDVYLQKIRLVKRSRGTVVLFETQNKPDSE